MKKLLLILIAGALAFAVIGCQDAGVTETKLAEQELPANTPPVSSLYGEFSGSGAGTTLDKTVATVANSTTTGEVLSDTTETTEETLTTWDYSLVIAAGATATDDPTFTLTATETVTDPGLKVSDETTSTSGTTETVVTTNYARDTQDSANDDLVTRVDQITGTYLANFAGSVDGGTVTVGPASGSDFGTLNSPTNDAAVAITGISDVELQKYELSGTVQEINAYDPSLGRQIKSLVFIPSGKAAYTQKTHAGTRRTTVATPVAVFDTTTTALPASPSVITAEGFDISLWYDAANATWTLSDIFGFDFDGTSGHTPLTFEKATP